METINEFKGKYFFLSNFYEAPVFWEGLDYRNNEAAFQSAKCRSIAERKGFQDLPPNLAKSKGRRVVLRLDWEQIKDKVMYQIVKAKFEQNRDLTNLLLQTGEATLIEGNHWGDNYWGICPLSNDNPETPYNNHLGKILMRVRKELLR